MWRQSRDGTWTDPASGGSSASPTSSSSSSASSPNRSPISPFPSPSSLSSTSYTSTYSKYTPSTPISNPVIGMSVAHDHRSLDGHLDHVSAPRSLSHSPTTSLSYASSSHHAPFSVPSRPSLSSASSSDPQDFNNNTNNSHHPSNSKHDSFPTSRPSYAPSDNAVAPEPATVVDTSFDESVLRALCELDVSSRLSTSTSTSGSDTHRRSSPTVRCSALARPYKARSRIMPSAYPLHLKNE